MDFSLTAGLLLVAAVSLGVYTLFIAPYELRLTRLELPVEGLAPELDGYTIGVIADIHHWPGVSLRHLERAITRLNAARPDAVLLLGDFSVSWKRAPAISTHFYRRAMSQLEGPLRRIQARDGVFAVLGNHDHYAGGARVARWLRNIGVHVLTNDCAAIARGAAGARLLLAGVGDALEDRVDPGAGCGAHPAGLPTIVMAHNPDAVLTFPPPGAEHHRRIDLVLSGHTHGGQYVIPGYGAPVTFSKVCRRKTAAGFVPNDHARLYVSRGLGTQLPGRFNCPPELVILKLRAKK